MSPNSSHPTVLDRTAKQLVGIDMYFDLVDIRLFENIAQTNSLTHGAEHSHVSVPAASARIKNIEKGVDNSRVILLSYKYGAKTTSAVVHDHDPDSET